MVVIKKNKNAVLCYIVQFILWSKVIYVMYCDQM